MNATDQPAPLYALLEASMDAQAAHSERMARDLPARAQPLEDEIAEFFRLEMDTDAAVEASLDYMKSDPRIAALSRAFRHKTDWSDVETAAGIVTPR